MRLFNSGVTKVKVCLIVRAMDKTGKFPGAYASLLAKLKAGEDATIKRVPCTCTPPCQFPEQSEVDAFTKQMLEDCPIGFAKLFKIPRGVVPR